MNSTEYAKAITAEDLHIFLNLWPSVFQGFDEIQQSLADDQEKFLGNDAAPISWCHLYELPIKEHLVAVLTAEHLPRAEIAGWLGQIVAAPSQFAALPAFTANSGSNWTRIPRQTGQPFQSKLDTDSTANWTVK